jgi:hypothetical protein
MMPPSRERGNPDGQETAFINGNHQGPRWRALWHEQALHRLPCMRQRQTARQKADRQKKRGLTVRFRSSEHFLEHFEEKGGSHFG